MTMLSGVTNNVRFMTKGVEIDDRTKEYIIKRLGNLDKVISEVIQTEVEIDLDKKGKFRAEVMIKTPRNLFRAEDTTESIEGSIDLVMEQLNVQITRKKEKIMTKIIRGARSIKKKFTIDKDARF